MEASVFLEQLKTLSREDLMSIKGIGEVLTDNVLEFTESPRYHTLIKEFKRLESQGKGLTITTPSLNTSGEVQTLPLAQETIVITGSFDIPRPQIKELLEQRGAKVTESVSSSTTLLIAGDKAGSKYDKAIKLGIKIIHNYQELLS